MLAELIAINAAYKVISTSIANGKQLSQISSDVLDKYFGARKAIAKKVANNDGNPLELWQAQEDIRKKEDQLKWMLNKQRIHGYSDYVKFRSAHSRQIKDQERLEARKRYEKQKAFADNIKAVAKALFILLVIAFALLVSAIYIKTSI